MSMIQSSWEMISPLFDGVLIMRKHWMKRGLKVLGAVLLVGSLVGCFHHSREEMAEKIHSKITDKLELDTVQQEKLKIVITSMQEQHKKWDSSRSRFVSYFKETLKSGEPQEAKLQELAAQSLQEVQSWTQSVIPALVDLQSTLNPDQRKKLQGYLEKWEDRHSRRH
jgi:Spy/CpxP family protein refolding chaperone